MINVRGLLTAGLDSFGRVSSEKWNTLVRAVRELQNMDKRGSGETSGVTSSVTLENFQSLLKRYGESLFLSKQHEDETSYLLKILGGAIFDMFLKSTEFKLGNWTTDDDGVEHNDGKGFSIWENIVDDWIMEIDYATVRHLLRAKELYTQTAHIGEVTNQTVFKIGLQTLGNILIGRYAEGVQGGIITPEGHVEIATLITRGLAKLQELFVVNDSTFGGNLSSIEFISSFLGGKGWSIQKKTRINAAGVEEEYYQLEIDSVTVRETLRVYEMVVSQLRGEFDNYVFAAMMEVHHYDPETKKVWLTTESGRIKAVPFKQGDYIKVQQYQAGNDVVSGGDGYITKSYELIITDSGTGGQEDENGDRLDWVTFKNFTTSIDEGTPETVIQKKDTFVRIDNETDPERKGLMQIITVGPNTPYQDVYYGMKTDPNDALKLRTGNLQGIRTDLFGWLEGYGAYLPNVYAVGKFYNRQTGESLNTSIEITRERLKSVYSETVFNIKDEDNFLKNGFFVRDMESWTKCNVDGSAASDDVQPEVINSGDGTPLMVNGAILAYMNRMTSEVTDYDGIKVLHLLGMGVYQDFDDITANSTHKANKSDDEESEDYTEMKDVADTLYMGVRMIALSAGTLSVSFVRSNGQTIASWSEQMNASREWTLVQARDSENQPWAYTGKQGRMILSYTGECYIRFVALRTDPIVNSKETYETLFEQTSRHITLRAMKLTDDLNKAVADFTIKYNSITQTVSNNWDVTKGAFDQMGVDISKRDQELEAQYGILATWKQQTDSTIISVAANFDSDGNIKSGSKVDQTFQSVITTVNDNWDAADLAFRTLTDGLNTEVGNREALENAYHATWVYQNDTLLSLMAAEFDANGKIKGYADLKIQVNNISTTVTNNKTASDAAFRTLTDSLNAEISNREALENAYHATWVYQNDHLLSLMAAEFNADGTIKGYADLKVQVNNMSTTVTDNKTAADRALSSLNTKYNNLDDSLDDLWDYAEEIDGEQTDSATWISQNKNKWSVVAASFDSDGTVKASGKVGLYVSDKLSTFEVDADNIKFTTFEWSVKNPSNQEIFHLDSDGNLTIAGKFHGEFDNTVTIGTGTKKMYIEPTYDGARLVGKDGSTTKLTLGFWSVNSGPSCGLFFGDGSAFVEKQLIIKGSNGNNWIRADISSETDRPEIILNYGSQHANIYFNANGKLVISSTAWPQEGVDDISALSVGSVYLRGDSCLGVRT